MDTSVRVAIVIPEPPWFHGGIERVVSESVRRLRRRFTIEIVCGSTSGKKATVEWEGLPVHVFSTMFRTVAPIREIRRLLNEIGPNLVHAHGHSSFAPLAVARRPRCIVTPHYHAHPYTRLLKVPRLVWDGWLGEFVYPHVNRIICVSRSEADLFSTRCHVPMSEIHLVPNGVDVERLRSASPVHTDGRMLLFTGRVERYKNLDRIVAALHFLPTDIHLSIIGQGRDERRLERLAKRYQVETRVHFLGPLEDSQAFSWLRSTAAGISLSTTEAFGIFPLECLAVGKPVIVGPAPGFIDLAAEFPDSVFVTSIATPPDQIAGRILRAMEAFSPVDVSRYDWNQVTDLMAAKYLEVCG